MENLSKSELETRSWACNKFGIKEEDFGWYNSGSCYDRIIVMSEEAAIKVCEKVTGTANGGMLDGMPLGGYHKTTYKGKEAFDVTC